MNEHTAIRAISPGVHVVPVSLVAWASRLGPPGVGIADCEDGTRGREVEKATFVKGDG